MNKNQYLTKDNIDDKEKVMKDHLEYFSRWYNSALVWKTDKDKWGNGCWEKTFISIQTYKNLRIGISSFFDYTRIQLKRCNPPKFVTFLFANTSSI